MHDLEHFAQTNRPFGKRLDQPLRWGRAIRGSDPFLRVTCWPLLRARSLYGRSFSDQEAEDVVQETVIGVARKMAEFRYDPAVCSFKGWLMHRVPGQFKQDR